MNKREIFIQKRAEGLSYEKISNEIGISKPTLLKWGKEEQNEIKMAAKNIDEKFFQNVRKQANERKEKLIKIMNAAYNALTVINYEELSAADLLNLIVRFESKLKEYIDFKLSDERYHVNIGRLGTSILNYEQPEIKRNKVEGGGEEVMNNQSWQ
jgi:hypothetical protein